MKNEITVKNSTDSFVVFYQSKRAKVQVVYMSGEALFQISMEDVEPFTIKRAKDYKGKKIWTGMPEENQELAEQFGALIEKHLRSNSK